MFERNIDCSVSEGPDFSFDSNRTVFTRKYLHISLITYRSQTLSGLRENAGASNMAQPLSPNLPI